MASSCRYVPAKPAGHLGGSRGTSTEGQPVRSGPAIDCGTASSRAVRRSRSAKGGRCSQGRPIGTALACRNPDEQLRRLLRREVGVGGAVMLGLGSIIGTGVFVSLGIAAGVTGSSVVLAVAIGRPPGHVQRLELSSAGGEPSGEWRHVRIRLPLSESVARVHRRMGLHRRQVGLRRNGRPWFRRLCDTAGRRRMIPGSFRIGLAAVATLTVVVLLGLRRSNAVNTIIVAVTLAALGAFVLVGLPDMDGARFRPFLTDGAPGLLEATALMFVAFTGYGRIATLGEEVKDPARTIPRAVIVTLAGVGRSLCLRRSGRCGNCDGRSAGSCGRRVSGSARGRRGRLQRPTSRR